MRVDTILAFHLLQIKISSHATSSPPCFNGERWCLSVYTLHLIVPPRLKKKQKKQQTLEISAGTCPIVSVPFRMATAKQPCVLDVSRTCSGELFAGTANAHHGLSMTSINKSNESVDFYLIAQLTQKWQNQLHRAVNLVQSYDLTSRGWALARR